MELQIRNSERDKLIFNMYEKGYIYKEIAKELNISPVRVGQLYRRVLEEKGLLRDKLKRKKAA